MKKVVIAAVLCTLALFGSAPASALDNTNNWLVLGPPVVQLNTLTVSQVAAEAQAGLPDAQAQLGEAYLFGNGVSKDYTKAIIWLSKAADQGNTDAYKHVANMYYSGRGVVLSQASSLSWLQKSADADDGQGQFTLGKLYYSGTLVPQDYVEAYKWISLCVRQNPYCDFAIPTKNEITSKMTPRQVAEANKKIAAWRAQPKNPNQAVAELVSYRHSPEDLQSLITLAEAGNPLAQFAAARLYASGKVGSKSPERAAHWFRKAAEQGHAGAQARLAVAYFYGHGVAKNEALGIDWLWKAADRGIRDAQFSMGEIYYNGYAVPVDFVIATGWYQKAAEQANAQAQHNLAISYLNGVGVERDYIQSYKWMGLAIKYAAQSDLQEWNSEAYKIAALMTPEQVNEARKQIDNWQPEFRVP
jgi:TPR repeat protein